MAYIKHFIAVLLTCGMQYACSYGLIVLGYYFNWFYFAGGFIVWFIVFGSRTIFAPSFLIKNYLVF